MTHRIVVLVAMVVLGGAAPARAWCEASCIAPTPEAQSHCPTHSSSDSETRIAGATLNECAALESARPSAPARLDAFATTHARWTPDSSQRSFYRIPPARPSNATTVFERSTPLRI